MFFARAGESSAACSITASSEPYCAISCPAVLSPIPGTPGMLSRRVALEADEVRDLVGPDRRSAPRRARACRRCTSATPRGVIIRQTFSEQSWNASRSVETTHVLMPAASARVASVAITSSASQPSNSRFAVAERLDDRPEVRELLAQQVRHRLAALLVDDAGGLGGRGALDRPRVPRDGDALRPVVGEQLEEHVREAEQRVRRLAVARRELLGQREEGAVGEVVAVDEEELGSRARARRRARARLPSASSARANGNVRVSDDPALDETVPIPCLPTKYWRSPHFTPGHTRTALIEAELLPVTDT